MKYPPISNNAQPKNFFIIWLHLPALGIEVKSPVKVPRIKKSIPIPREKESRREMPKKRFCFFATNSSIPPRTGAAQGEAIIPEVIPIRRAERKSPPFLVVVKLGS